MNETPHSNRDNGGTKQPRDNHAIAMRAARTRRLKAANKPFEVLDKEVADVVRRMDRPSGDEEHLDRNVGRVMLQGLALRKDLELAKDRRTEVIMKLEEVDVRTELEELKDDLDDLGYTINT
jgi:hypothetical protein